jgi:NAD(P)-dependent dehydrogenase (short-subunit alcohol dehydrogenase family)
VVRFDIDAAKHTSLTPHMTRNTLKRSARSPTSLPALRVARTRLLSSAPGQCGCPRPGVDSAAGDRWSAGARPADVRKHTPLARAGQPAELAPLFVLLASDESSFSTGQVFAAVGGHGGP